MEDSEIEKKFEEILEKKLPEILEKTEELKRRKKEEEKRRHQYVEKIWKYFPGANTRNLSTEEVKKISEQLEELAKKLNYTPVISKQAKTKFWGGKGKKKRIALVVILSIVMVIAAISKLIMGWW